MVAGLSHRFSKLDVLHLAAGEGTTDGTTHLSKRTVIYSRRSVYASGLVQGEDEDEEEEKDEDAETN